MWSIIDQKHRVALIVVTVIVVFLFFFEVLGESFPRSVSYTITCITIGSLLIGKFLWKCIYIDFLKENLCPDFNGNWLGIIESNYEDGTRVEIPIEIKADFFGIRMISETTLGRSYSNYCRVQRTEDGSFELEYMFKAFNDEPSKTDTSFYEGAARVRVLDTKTMNMKGVFWTNRCWQQGKNTAGIITLEKQ